MNTVRSKLAKVGIGDRQDTSLNAAMYGSGVAATSTTGGGRGAYTASYPITGAQAARQARMERIAIWVKLFAIGSYFLALCLAIGLTVFQNKWIGKPSGLSGFLLFCSASFILLLVVLTVVPAVAAKTGGTKWSDLEHALAEKRPGFVAHGYGLLMGMIIALTQLISALTLKGCKNPADDPYATSSTGNDDDFQSALAGFCSTKKAEAAFLWMGWVSFVILSGFFFYNFRLSRKAGPKIPGFNHPGGASSDGAFQPIYGEDDEDADDPYAAYGSQAGGGSKVAYQPQDVDAYAARYAGYDDDPRFKPRQQQSRSRPTSNVGYAPPASTAYQNPLSDIAARYGMNAVEPEPQESSDGRYQPTSNPFADALANVQSMSNYGHDPATYHQAYGGVEGGAPIETRQSYDYGFSGYGREDPHQRAYDPAPRAVTYSQEYIQR